MKTLLLENAWQSGFPNKGNARTGYTAPSLYDALVGSYKTDVHLTQYFTPVISRRLDNGVLSESMEQLRRRVQCHEETQATKWRTAMPTSERIDAMTDERWKVLGKIRATGGVKMHCMLFDIDGPKGANGECDVAYRDKIRKGVHNLFSEHPGFAYMTRGGARIAYSLPSPVVLIKEADAYNWTAMYHSYCNYVSQWTQIPTCLKTSDGIGIGLDLACRDWSHLFRAPRTIRPIRVRRNGKIVERPGKVMENRGCMGNLDEPFYPIIEQLLRVKVQPEVREPSQMSGDTGILKEMFEAWGALGERKSNCWCAKCPLWQEHSDSRDGLDSSTVIYGSNRGESGWGTIYCSHKTHNHLRGAGDWIQKMKWNDEDFKLSKTWRSTQEADQGDSWGDHEDLK